MAFYGDGSNVPLLVAFALVAFVGSATAARLAERGSGTGDARPAWPGRAVSAAVVDIVSAVLLVGGALQCFLGAVGLARLPSLLSRMQAATKPQTLGLLLILAGIALRVPLDSAVTLLLVGVFQLITAPVIAQLLGRSAHCSGAVRPGVLVVDELDERMPHEGPERPDRSPAGG